MGADRRLILVLQRAWEVAQKLAFQQRVVGQVRSQDLVVEIDLGVGQQHRKLGPGEVLAVLRTRAHRRAVGQEFDDAVEMAFALQGAHEALQPVVLLARLFGGDADRLALLIVMAQHQRGDLVGHGEQQGVAVLALQQTAGDRLPGRDLDVDLVVRGVDPGRIVERVGVDLASAQGRFDPAALRQTEVGAFADHAHAQLGGVDAQGIVGTIARVGIALSEDACVARICP